MFKVKVSFIVLLSCLAAEPVLAQPFSFQPPKEAPAQQAITTPAVPKVDVMTPNQFQSQVKALHQQNQDELSKQIDKMIPKKSSAATDTSDKTPPATAPSSSDTETIPPAPLTPVPPAASQAAPSAPAASTYAPAFPSEQDNSAASAADTSTTSSPASKPAQPYTGFGAGGSSGNATTNSGAGSQSSGGWSIKY